MTQDEKDNAEAGALAARERRRIVAAASIAAASIVGAVVVAGVILAEVRPAGAAVLQPLLALMLSLAIVAGLRAIDGPVALGGRRREAQSSSAAASALLLWLGCFGAIQTAILVVDVSDKLLTGRADCSPGVSEGVRGMLADYSSGTRRLFSFEGCRTPQKPAAADAAGKGSNG